MTESDSPFSDATAALPNRDTAPSEDVQDPPHPYNTTALARLMLSDAYREVAERALHGITTRYDNEHFAGGGSYVEEAASLVRHAEVLLRWAVIYERERRTSWEDIGAALGITKQSAHERFGKHVTNWREPLDKPEHHRSDGTPDDPRMPYGLRYIWGSHGAEVSQNEKTAAELERWLKEHTAPSDSWANDKHPVTAELPRHSTASMTMLLDNVSRRLLDDQMVPDPRAQADVCDRRVALYERMIREDEVVPADIHKWIQRDRARAAELRATPGTGTPWPAEDPGGKG
ncbi:hypothetical protein [Streptomyces olivaceoviridis]|uniref:hypothetical protein n=1 Tax=Streptomyces olivaceoviridis TaxID=1921 RepID=UPI00332D193E